MGNCACTSKKQKNKQEQIREALVTAIDNGRVDLVETYYHQYMKSPHPDQSPEFNLEDRIITLQEVSINSLAYAFRTGQTAIVRYLIDTARASVVALYDTFKFFGRTPMDVACECGYLDLVQYFLPLHLQQKTQNFRQQSVNASIEELSIFSDQNHQPTTLNQEITLRFTPSYQPAIHRACDKGHIQVVDWLFQHFRNETPPMDFDIGAVDEKAGENCALVSCRNGNFQMMKFLHETCAADFHKLNRRSENAIQITAIGSKRREAKNYLECMRYLVELVGVDVIYEYEETLLVCEDKSIISYLEKQLRMRGIEASKAKVELEYSISKNRAPRILSSHSQELEQRFRNVGAKFQLKDLFDEGASKSNVSSIPLQVGEDVSSFSVL